MCKIEQHLKVKKCITLFFFPPDVPLELTYFFYVVMSEQNHAILTIGNIFVILNDWIVWYCFHMKTQVYIFSATSLNQKHRYESPLFHSMHIHGCTVAHWPSNLIRATSPQSRTIAVSLILNEECLQLWIYCPVLTTVCRKAVLRLQL